jgi:hypothetical protein
VFYPAELNQKKPETLEKSRLLAYVLRAEDETRTRLRFKNTAKSGGLREALPYSPPNSTPTST